MYNSEKNVEYKKTVKEYKGGTIQSPIALKTAKTIGTGIVQKRIIFTFLFTFTIFSLKKDLSFDDIKLSKIK